MPSPEGKQSAIEALFQRYAGKKSAIAMIGIVCVFMSLNTYSEYAGDQFRLDHIVELCTSAMFAVAVIVAGVALGQGIGDHGSRRKPEPENEEPSAPK